MPPNLPPFCKIYKAMNSARHVTEFIADKLYMPPSLCGACAIGAVALHRSLFSLGIMTKLIVNRWYSFGHVYVTYKHYVLDITATQFGRSKILITTTDKLNGKHLWMNRLYTFDTEDELIEYLLSIDWKSDQLPDKSLLNEFNNELTNII